MAAGAGASEARGPAPIVAEIREGAACTPRRGLTNHMGAAEMESVLRGCVVPGHSERTSDATTVHADPCDLKGSPESSTGPISAARLNGKRAGEELMDRACGKAIRNLPGSADSTAEKSAGPLRAEDTAKFGAEIQRAMSAKPNRAGERQRQAERKRAREAEVRVRPVMELSDDAIMTEAQAKTARLLAKIRKKSQDSVLGTL